MASEQNHVALANRNHLLLVELIAAQKHSEWIATVAFYKAVHLVEAVFAYKHSRHSNSHTERLGWLKIDHAIGSCFGAYRSLMNASLVARYLDSGESGGVSTFESFMPLNDVIATLVYGKLVKVERTILSNLSGPSQKLLHRVLELPKS